MLIEMSIKGLMVDPVTNMPIVILRDAGNQQALPIWVGPVEANAIALQIENVAPPRPMTHDLVRDLLVQLGATLTIATFGLMTFLYYIEALVFLRTKMSPQNMTGMLVMGAVFSVLLGPLAVWILGRGGRPSAAVS